LDETLSTISGLHFSDASGSDRPNIKGSTGYSYAIALDPAYKVANAPALVDFLVESAWSVRDTYLPNIAVEFTFDGGPRPSDKVNLIEAAEVAGWVPVGSQAYRTTPQNGGSPPQFETGTSTLTVWLDNSDVSSKKADRTGAFANRKRLGEWPGNVPDLPTNMVVLRTSTP